MDLELESVDSIITILVGGERGFIWGAIPVIAYNNVLSAIGGI